MNLPKIFSDFFSWQSFRITPDRQNKVYEQIKENAKGDFDFYILSFFSGVIIMLGLIIDSAAVVIGGMLIAPLVWPIFLISLAILMGRGSIFEKALFTLIKSVIIIFIVALVIGFFLPHVNSGQEIISRTHPTLYELFIALASGFVGAFVISYPKLGNAMAGVVVAAALVPPLAVTGLALSQNDIASAGGSLLLFLSNLVAIIFAAGVLFLLAKFRGPSTVEGKEVRRSNIRWFILLFLIVLIPLYFITTRTITEEKRFKVVKQVLEVELPNIKLSDLEIKEIDKILHINITVRSDQAVSKSQVAELTDYLSKNFNKSVILKIVIVPVIEAGKLLPQPIVVTSTSDIVPN